jgi:hypothetical protein
MRCGSEATVQFNTRTGALAKAVRERLLAVCGTELLKASHPIIPYSRPYLSKLAGHFERTTYGKNL